MLSILARRLGVVRAARFVEVSRQLRKVEERLAKQAQSSDQVRKEVKTWKMRAEAAEKALARRESQLAQDRNQFESAKTDLERQLSQLRGDLELQTQRGERNADVAAVQKRLSDAERELKVAREYLLVMEAKLDVLEGAANVLDGRTRLLTLRRATADSSAAAVVDALERRLG
jgi:chromosome segregation ATPase